MAPPTRQEALFVTFWNFLSYLERYVEVVDLFLPGETDPARTMLVSMLTEHMRPIFRADLAFVGYRSLEEAAPARLQIVEESVKLEDERYRQSPLLKQMAALNWQLPYQAWEKLEIGSPILLFDEGLHKAPAVFQGLVTALAASKVALLGREYFLFFCDIEKKETDFPRYSDFDKAMLTVATGLLGVGFKSGVRRGRKAQQVIEEAQTRRFLQDLAHELKTPIQAIVADASNLQEELPPDLTELRQIATRNLNAAYHLSLLVDNIRLTLSGRNMPEESLVVVNIKRPLLEAISMFVGAARAKGLEIEGPVPADEQSLPYLPMYYNQLTIAFKNLVHNAITYSLPQAGQYRPVKIVGQREAGNFYAVDVINYGLEITPEEIAHDRLLNLRYRGHQARKLAASGSGLGLAFVRQAVERHGGTIQITSVPTGPDLFKNTFRLLLPTTLADLEKLDEQNIMGR